MRNKRAHLAHWRSPCQGAMPWTGVKAAQEYEEQGQPHFRTSEWIPLGMPLYCRWQFICLLLCAPKDKIINLPVIKTTA